MRLIARAVLFVLLCHSGVVYATSAGVSGYSGKDPEFDCTACHSGGPSRGEVTLDGPLSVDVESTATYTLTLHGAPGSVAGIDIASSDGTLSASSADTRIDASELVHRDSRRADKSGAIRFKFQWSAPDTPGTYTLFISAVVGNADNSADGDDVVRTQVDVEVFDRSASLNEAPFAQFYVPSTGLVGETVLMNATSSADADGEIVSYEWDFGDGEQKVLPEPTVEHKYSLPGLYTIQLMVTDDDGVPSSALAQIAVNAVEAGVGDARPTADAGGPYVAPVANTVRLDGSKSVASHEKGQIVSYEWDFGDGVQGSGETPTHIYDNPGDYIATLTVWDDRGLPNSAVAQVHVQAGETAKLGMLRIPSRIAIWAGEGVPYPFKVTASVNGLQNGATRCGVVYLKRNGEDYRHQTFCLTGGEERRLMFEHVFTDSDAPSVEWTAYAVLDDGSESQQQSRVSQVLLFCGDVRCAETR